MTQPAPRVRAVKLGWTAFGGWPCGADKPGPPEPPDELLARADLAVVPVFEDERPFRGVAAFIDWRGNGELTRWVDRGLFRGRSRERLLAPARADLGLTRVVFVGAGEQANFDERVAVDLAHAALEQATQLRAREVVVSWPSLESDIDVGPAHDAMLDALLEAIEAVGGGAGVQDALVDDADATVEPEPTSEAPPSPPRRWWLVADEALYIRLRGRLLGTPRAALP